MTKKKPRIGRPPKKAGEHVRTPVMQLGRVQPELQDELREAASRAGKSFTQWAVEILKRAARR